PGDPGQPGVATGIQAPLQVVALHDRRTRYLALLRPVRGGPDVDEHAAARQLAEGLPRRQPQPAGARGCQDLLDAAAAGRPGRHHEAAPSVASLTRPP